ncbi:Membrane-associated phosphatidylinositol transfer protein 1 [Araneus ventricosus]|uniref:Membrane-associated phosphatidylinositol transfer protein 1 n=1 Tax=Araneus ventricosus TaxID=182803 RepID=A0A4Y2FP08_ARAVE|nr:Membrane-associated phosphatidylinositol transfer protein 1 [Araneus ventricosus]
MLIKEYRIPLPLTVEEYRIAQLYMIAKKSRQESKGAGSGVEILVNEPYTDGPGGSGQYTHKVYHIGSHLPSWFKALLPKSALTAEEEAWNAYPYTKTRYTSPFVEKFFIEIETKYIDDAGTQDNVFNLSGSEVRNRTVDLIDVVKDQLYGSDYCQEEDPKLFTSSKSNRGPLKDDWLDEFRSGSGKPIMCAYKVCRVEFRYWGMQTKIEKFIHDVALRKTMLRAHRQAWAWQDEWHGLTMEDIRRLERETQEELAKKMSNEEEVQPSVHPSPSALSGQEVDLTAIDKDKDNDACVCLEGSPSPNRPRRLRNLSVANVSGEAVGDDGRQKLWSRSGSRTALCSPSGSSNASFDLQLANWRMESIVRDSETSSDDEYFDAEEHFIEAVTLARWSSVDLIPDKDDDDQNAPEPPDFRDDSIFSNTYIKKVQTEHARVRPPSVGSACPATRTSLDTSLPSTPTASPAHQSSCTTTVLALVMHAGSVLDSGAEPTTNKKTDVHTFASSFENVLRQHYPALLGHLSVRLVSCAPVCSEALAVLSNLSPYSFQSSPSAVEVIYHSYDSIPLGALPLFAVSSPEYQEHVTAVINAANEVYKEFLNSDDGMGFNGQVIIVADSVASLMAYDALCRTARYEGRYGSETSINDPEPVPTQPSSARSNPLISISDGGSIDEGVSMETRPRQSNQNAKIYRKSHSHPQESEPPHCDSFQVNRLLSAPNTRRHSSASNDQSSHLKFDFEVSDFFMFGSPLGTVLAYRKMLSFDDKNGPPPRPSCTQVYNLFHPTNPCASRVEPLLSARFAQLSPINIPRYQKYPLGDGQPLHLLEYIQTYPHLFLENQPIRRPSEASIASTMSGMVDMVPIATVTSMTQKWWGPKRIDYALYCPEGLSNFPTNALPHLFHASYWESNDVIAFILRQLMRSDSLGMPGDIEKEVATFIPTQPREKWLKKRTSVKLKNVTANHRANDIIVKDGLPQVISARFMYGPLDMVALTGEKVDIHIMKDQRRGEWTYLATEVTDKNGRLSYVIPKEKALGYGMFPVKLVVCGDHTSLDFFLTVIPPKTECVVFSIDGSFTASVSVTGKDPKVRAGAVDVVRSVFHEYLLIISY